MKRQLSLLAAAILIAACADTGTAPAMPDDVAPAFSATTSISNVSVPIALTVFIPCAAGGAGELVDLTGFLHLLTRITTDNTGGVHVKVYAQPQNVSGTGQTTGAEYRGTGVTQETDNIASDGLPAEFTFVNNFRVIGQGPGNNFLVHQTVHMTVNANGVVTADIDHATTDCK